MQMTLILQQMPSMRAQRTRMPSLQMPCDIAHNTFGHEKLPTTAGDACSAVPATAIAPRQQQHPARSRPTQYAPLV